MSWIVMLLLGFGIADLTATMCPRPPWVALTAGALAMAATAGFGGLAFDLPSWGAFAVSVASLWFWRRHAPRADDDRPTARRALAALGVPLLLLMATSGAAPAITGPLELWVRGVQIPWLSSRTASSAFALIAAAVFNVSTANLCVRSVLVAVGASPTRLQESRNPALVRPAQRLRGGRLLGPMERLLILGLTVAGNLEAAALVIAAKGLLRFPELQAVARSNTPLGEPPSTVDEVTEYFLVGSFTSWLVALSSSMLVG